MRVEFAIDYLIRQLKNTAALWEGDPETAHREADEYLLAFASVVAPTPEKALEVREAWEQAVSPAHQAWEAKRDIPPDGPDRGVTPPRGFSLYPGETAEQFLAERDALLRSVGIEPHWPGADEIRRKIEAGELGG